MASTEALSHAFIESHASDAARVLEHQPAQASAALIASLPARLAGPLVQHMLPASAARCLALMDEDGAAGIMRQLDTQAGTAILRHLPPARQDTLLTQLPTASAVALKLLLSYPDDTAGAWIDAHALALSPDSSAGETLARLRDTDHDPGELVYVLGSDRRLLGVATLVDLVRAEPQVCLAEIMNENVPRLSALSTLASLTKNDAWDSHFVLPVVERDDRFVGSLDRRALTRALNRRRPAADEDPSTGVLENLAGAYWLVFSGLLHAGISLLPVAAHRPPDHRHER